MGSLGYLDAGSGSIAAMVMCFAMGVSVGALLVSVAFIPGVL